MMYEHLNIRLCCRYIFIALMMAPTFAASYQTGNPAPAAKEEAKKGSAGTPSSATATAPASSTTTTTTTTTPSAASTSTAPGTPPAGTPATPGTTAPADPAATPPAAPPAGSPAPEAVQQSPSVAKNLVLEPPKPGTPGLPAKDLDVATTKRIELANHGTQVINLKQAAGQVLLTDPKVADVQLVTPSTLYVYGRSPGTTEIIVTGQDMQTAYRYQIHVISDYRELENLIRGFVPNGNVKVHSVPDGLMVQGTVDTAKLAEDIRALAHRYVGPQGSVVNQLKIKSSTQINLRVKIAEVKRTVVNQLGINWSTSPLENLRFGLFTGRGLGSRTPTTGVPTNFVPSTTAPIPGGIGMNFPAVDFAGSRTDFSALIDALAQESLASVLAEPNLVTRSGEEASFLVGGEYPYQITQGVGSAQTTTIQFKPYGISLSFVPVVIGDTISLRVRPEVSELDRTEIVRDQFGNITPSIRTRRAESTMEMANGQSMIMAGILSDVSAGAIDTLPGLGDIPILGALFRSANYKNQKTELVIVVTPYIVEPIDNTKDIVLPTDGLKYANLLDMILFQRINDPSGHAPCPNLMGNAGFYF
ncbi:MAG: type II and III secretion system protein family protein [Alphaproteobacteria bacterium]|nr:type II and III secretion system protein family protein [Alphaproteobacteria bacterium]